MCLYNWFTTIHTSERAAIKQCYFPVAVAIILFCPGFVYVTYYRIL